VTGAVPKPVQKDNEKAELHPVWKNETVFTTRFCLGSSTLPFRPSIVFSRDLGMLQLLEIFWPKDTTAPMMLP
jgi:hypothetical protein